MSTSYRVIELVRKAISTEYVTASDTQVARAMGISRASISAYKLGREVMSHEMLSRANVLMKLSNYQLGELGWQLLNERARSDQERSVYAAMRAAGRAIARSVLLAAAIGLGAGALPSQHVRSAELGGTSPAVYIMVNRKRKLFRRLKRLEPWPLLRQLWARMRCTGSQLSAWQSSPAYT